MNRRATWFATLRRDRGVFALLAVILILVQSVQPLAAAGAQNLGGMPVICTAMAADDGAAQPGAPLRHESCAKCIAGACGFAPLAKALTPGLPAWAQPAMVALPAWRLDPPIVAFRDISGRSPAIRAPPVEI